MSEAEAAAIRRASSGQHYQTSLVTAGKRVAARLEIDHGSSMIGARHASVSLAPSYQSLAEKAAGGAWEEEQAGAWGGTAPPTPIASWLSDAQPLFPAAASMAIEVGRTRNAETAPASVHGKQFREPEATHREIGTGPASVHGPSRSYRAGEYELYPSAHPYDAAAAAGTRARTPEPRARTPDIARTLVRNMGPSYESNGPVEYDDEECDEDDFESYEHERLSLHVPHARRMSETAEPDGGRHSVGGLPPLPSKAELFQYVRELVDAKKELRAHFNVGALHGLKAHYKGK